MNLTINFPEPNSTQLRISFSDNVITDISFCQSESDQNTETTAFIKQIQHEFQQYFSQPGFRFSLPCQLNTGTPFQQKVWQALARIPSGQVETYGSLAKKLNTSARAIGNACRQNPCPVIVPCHRVISASGLGGFAGDTLKQQKSHMNFMQIKQWLLEHERADYQ